MRKRIPPRRATVFALAIAAATASADTFVYDIVGGWTIHTDRGRGFSCFMQAQYEGGSTIRVGFDATGELMHLMVADPVWESLRPGIDYPVEIRFGDEPPWSGHATGYLVDGESPQTTLRFEVGTAGRADFVEQLMRAYSVDVSLDGGAALSLSLAGSYRAALKLTECQEAMVGTDEAPRAEPEPDSDPRSRGGELSARH